MSLVCNLVSTSDEDIKDTDEKSFEALEDNELPATLFDNAPHRWLAHRANALIDDQQPVIAPRADRGSLRLTEKCGHSD